MKLLTGIVLAGLLVAGPCAMIINQLYGSEEVVAGSEYTYSYRSCVIHQPGIKGQAAACTQYINVNEARVRTVVHGLMWESSSYKIVK